MALASPPHLPPPGQLGLEARSLPLLFPLSGLALPVSAEVLRGPEAQFQGCRLDRPQYLGAHQVVDRPRGETVSLGPIHDLVVVVAQSPGTTVTGGVSRP